MGSFKLSLIQEMGVIQSRLGLLVSARHRTPASGSSVFSRSWSAWKRLREKGDNFQKKDAYTSLFGGDLASLCRNLGALTDGFGKLWIWEWFRDLSNRLSGWVNRRLHSEILCLTLQKLFRIETCFLCCRIIRAFGHLCCIVSTAAEDGALRSSHHSVLQ